jgi:hypothetical protein
MTGENPYQSPRNASARSPGERQSYPERAFKLWQGASLLGLACPFWGCCCMFQPSWANGWPVLSFRVVFGSSFAIATFLGVFGLGGIVSLMTSNRRTAEQLTWGFFWAHVLATAMIGALLACLAFLWVYTAPDFERAPFSQ